jgi:hypothetical protein
LPIQEQKLPPEHRNITLGLSGLAGIYNNQDRYGEAERFFARALSINEQARGPMAPDELALGFSNLAGVYVAQSRNGPPPPP